MYAEIVIASSNENSGHPGQSGEPDSSLIRPRHVHEVFITLMKSYFTRIPSLSCPRSSFMLKLCTSLNHSRIDRLRAWCILFTDTSTSSSILPCGNHWLSLVSLGKWMLHFGPSKVLSRITKERKTFDILRLNSWVTEPGFCGIVFDVSSSHGLPFALEWWDCSRPLRN